MNGMDVLKGEDTHGTQPRVQPLLGVPRGTQAHPQHYEARQVAGVAADCEDYRVYVLSDQLYALGRFQL